MKKINKIKWLIASLIAIIGIGVIVYLFPVWLKEIYGTYYTNETERGTFGDSFGVLNTLFSGLAFALLIITAWMQSSELRIQRKELKDTRREFEFNRLTNIAYHQLERIENSIQAFVFEEHSNKYKGYEAFDKALSNLSMLQNIFEARHSYFESQILGHREILVANELRDFINIHIASLYSFSQIINKSELSIDEKEIIAKIVSENIPDFFYNNLVGIRRAIDYDFDSFNIETSREEILNKNKIIEERKLSYYIRCILVFRSFGYLSYVNFIEENKEFQ